MKQELARRELLKATGASLALLGLSSAFGEQTADLTATRYNYAPKERNVPLGVARGIFPGRVVWSHDPKAAHWSGDRDSEMDQWWMDASTDQDRVDTMLSATLRTLTGTSSDSEAWSAIFQHFHRQAHGREAAYRPSEIVAIKANLNSSSAHVQKNLVNTSPQLVLAMVRQLVRHAEVRPQDIVIYDARRAIFTGMLNKIWNEYRDIRFVQMAVPDPAHQTNPGYGQIHSIEAARWVEGVSYSANRYNEAKLIPQQIMDAAYIVNLAMLKGHSYPYAAAEGGDEGQTGVSMSGKNHFGSIKGTPELHEAINTNQGAKPHAYSPIVDLAASPNLGAKTILYVLDGLYCGRRHQSYPLHFPNAPFHNRVEPYSNPDWPSSILASFDGVALDSVGLDILHAQTKNNYDDHQRPRILLRENAEDYLMEQALADNPPSATAYRQNGKPVTSLGVFEHWDSDETRQYSRNQDPKHGKGIELVYLLAEK